jgi:uncharacterized membrane protein
VGRALSRLFVLGAAGLGGIGVYLGRFHRWSNWDVLLHPQAVLLDVLAGLNRPWTHLRPWGLCALFALFMLICYAALAPPLESSNNSTPVAGDA